MTKSTETSEMDKLLKEVRALRKSVDELQDEARKHRPATFAKQFGRSVSLGLARGIGFFVATTILAMLVFYGLKGIIDSGIIQDWAQETIKASVDASIESSMQQMENRFQLPF